MRLRGRVAYVPPVDWADEVRVTKFEIGTPNEFLGADFATMRVHQINKSDEETKMLNFYAKVSDSAQDFIGNKSGATAVKIGLIAAGIAAAIIVNIGLLGGELSTLFNTVTTELDVTP